MTLCVAWRYENKFCLASDSCIANLGETYTHNGIKVLQIPVNITGATNWHNGHFETRFSSIYGMAISGSYLTAFLTKELLAEVLMNLQYLAPLETLSAERIADVAFSFYKYSAKKLVEAYGYGHDTDIFLVGSCPARGTPRAFKFFRGPDGNLMSDEILTSEPFAFDAIGAGEGMFRDRFEKRLRNPTVRVHFAIPNVIREVIESGAIPSVGGALQYGEIEGSGPFELKGVVDYEVQNRQILSKPAFRGINLKEVYDPQGLDDLHVRYSYIDPFGENLRGQ